MDQRQIEIFRAVIDQGSVTAAARVLAVSQPAVSGSLAKLEKRLGFDLFRREGRRLVATPEARLLHMEASHLLDGFERLAEAPFANGELVLRRYVIPRVVVLPRSHRLAACAELTPQLLDGEDIVATVRSSWSWAGVARAFDQAGAVCRVVAECEFTPIALNMVAAGAGICFADPITAATIGDVLVQRPFR